MKQFTKDFSQKTLKGLSQKSIRVVGVQAVPGFPGDEFFTGKAYALDIYGCQYLRPHKSVMEIAGMSEQDLDMAILWESL
jgi:hypothetical protein